MQRFEGRSAHLPLSSARCPGVIRFGAKCLDVLWRCINAVPRDATMKLLAGGYRLYAATRAHMLIVCEDPAVDHTEALASLILNVGPFK